MEGVLLGKWDQLRVDVVHRVFAHEMDFKEGCKVLNVSESTLKRYLRAFRHKGIAFVVHGNKGRAPANKKPDELKASVQDLVSEHYFDFNLLHAAEKMKAEAGIEIKRETLRRWMHEIGMVKRAKKRRTPARFRRERMSQAGLMVMMDGSYHRWWGTEKSCLIVTLDDATSDILWAEFCSGETTANCLRVLKQTIQQRGVFRILYVDQAGVYGGMKRHAFSYVMQAMGDLGIQVIFAHSPEAKGRIERLFQTLQDRLIPEMRLAGVSSMAQANRYLREVYLPHLYRPKFALPAHNPVAAYLPLPAGMDLDRICRMRDRRIVAKDHTFSLGGHTYLILDALKYSIAKHYLEIVWDEEGGAWSAYFAGKPLQVARFTRAQKIPA